jgi:Na+/H+ antiporter NhaD/arsenite permease-like protein
VYASLAFLFGIAAQFRAMEGYSFLQSLISRFEKRIGILFTVVLVTTLFSPFILNDVVVIILTPAIVRYSKEFSIDIAPILVAEITFTNVASSITPFGNPQNILLWTASKLTVTQFVSGTWAQLTISGAIALLALLPYRRKHRARDQAPVQGSCKLPGIYLCVITAIVVASSVLGMPSYISLGVAFLSGFIFTYSKPIPLITSFDAKSLLVLCAFVAATTVFSLVFEDHFAIFLSPVGRGVQPYSALAIALISNIISNVPTTQLVLSATKVLPSIAPKIAVEAGLAGNIGPIASFANLLVLLIVRRSGVPIRKTILLQLVVGLAAFLPALL